MAAATPAERKWEARVLLGREAEAGAALAAARELGKGKTKFIRDSLEQNVKDFLALPARDGATTRPG